MFLIKAKLSFFTGCPKSALRGGKTKYFPKIPSEMTTSKFKCYLKIISTRDCKKTLLNKAFFCTECYPQCIL